MLMSCSVTSKSLFCSLSILHRTAHHFKVTFHFLCFFPCSLRSCYEILWFSFTQACIVQFCLHSGRQIYHVTCKDLCIFVIYTEYIIEAIVIINSPKDLCQFVIRNWRIWKWNLLRRITFNRAATNAYLFYKYNRLWNRKGFDRLL